MNQQFPSTVDMNAFKAGPSDSAVKDVNLSSSSSDSDGSDSSDSDTSSSSDDKDSKFSSKTAQFSVTSSDAAGLRMKIAAINPPHTKSMSPLCVNEKSVNRKTKSQINNKNNKNCENVSSSSSCCSDCDNDSDSDTSSDEDDDDDDEEDDNDDDDEESDESEKPSKKNVEKKIVKNDKVKCQPTTHKNRSNDKNTKKSVKANKSRANRNGSTSSGGGRTDTSESDSSDDLLKEINEEDLAAILPADELNLLETNCSGSNNNNNNNNNNGLLGNKPAVNSTLLPPSYSVNNHLPSPGPNTLLSKNLVNDIQQGDCASSSDNDTLPALVSAAIQRVESCSDNESISKPIAPTTQYNISLLRDFVVKTQMLGNPTSCSNVDVTCDDINLNKNSNNEIVKIEQDTTKTESQNKFKKTVNNSEDSGSKKKRGRPKKPQPSSSSNNNNNTNNVSSIVESPDSGILSTPQSPAGDSPKNNISNTNSGVSSKKPKITIPVKKDYSSPKKEFTGSFGSSSTSGSTNQSNKTKLNLTSLEKCIYATERVLYPPRSRSNRSVNAAIRQTRSKSVGLPKKEDHIDPVWRKIDITKKFRRPSTSGYKSDGGSTVCSKKLAAQSGYVSDYSSVGHHNRCSSGYRSDYSVKSRKSGYRSDYSVKSKCGYRSDCSIRHRKKVRRKRRSKFIQTKSDVNEQDILQLACLTLGQTSEESSRDSYTPPTNTTIKPSILTTSFSNIANGIFSSSTSSFTTKKPSFFSSSNFEGKSFFNTSKSFVNSFSGKFSCNNNTNKVKNVVPERLELKKSNVEALRRSRRSLSVKPVDSSSLSPKKVKDENGELCLEKSQSIKHRRSSVVSRCSSRSTSSRHPFRRRRHKRFKSRSRSESIYKGNDSIVDVDELVNSFTELCLMQSEKKGNEKFSNNNQKNELQNTNNSSSVVSTTEKNIENVTTLTTTNTGPATTTTTTSKRITKKRKGSEHVTDSPSTSSTGKRRHKKTVPTQSPDDHKLPLKKRHYLLTPGEKSEQKNENGDSKNDGNVVSSPSSNCSEKSERTRSHHIEDGNSNNRNVLDNGVKLSQSKAVTPKKRHLLESPESKQNELSSNIKKSESPLTIDIGKNTHLDLSQDFSITESIQLKSQNTPKTKSDILTRKKNRLESLVSKMTSSSDSCPSPSSPTPPNSREKHDKKSTTQSGRPTVIRTPGRAPPPGVFEPTVDLELQIPETTIAIPSMITKAEFLDSPRFLLDENKKDENLENSNKKPEKVVESLLNKTVGNLLMKKKRKKINRTGFPTVRKKKKRCVEKLNDEVSEIKIEENLSTSDVGERVPKEGETADTFIERNNTGNSNTNNTNVQRPRLSVISLERLQGKSTNEIPEQNVEILPEGSKRQLRNKTTSGKDKTEMKKRERDGSQDTQNNSKKSKNEIIHKISPAVSKEMNKKKDSRDTSSDNEPLVNYINKTVSKLVDNKTDQPESSASSSSSSSNNKKVTNSQKLKDLEKENLIKPDEMKLRASRRQSFCASKASTENPKNLRNSSQDKNDSSGKPSNIEYPRLSVTRKSKSSIIPAIETLPPSSLQQILLSKKLEEQNKIKLQTKSTEEKIEMKKNNKTSTPLSTRAVLNATLSGVKRNLDVDEEVKETKRPNSRNMKKLVDDKKVDDIKKVENISSRVSERRKSIFREKNQNKLESEQKNSEKAKGNAKNGINNHINNNNNVNINNNNKKTLKCPPPSPTLEEIEKIDISLAELETNNEHEPLPESENYEVNPNSRDLSPASTISERNLNKKNPKFRKKYISAGLLSNTFKEDEHVKISRSLVKCDQGPMAVDGSLLPPPPYCENYLRQSIQDFQLPYDLWWTNEYSKLPGRETVPSWNYKKIRTNVYCDVKANPSTDHQPCSCKPDSGCPDDCLNRLVYTECRPETCPCAEKCQNQKIQKHEYHPGIERYMTENKGWGIRSKQDINKGSFILEYLGEVVTEREFKERMASRYAKDTHHYCLHLDGGLVIDGHRMGSDGRFVNHSCSPNCEIQKWSVNGLFRMALFALRDIKAGEELTYDYNFSLFNLAEGQPCRCETPQCRGVIGGKSQRIKPIEVKVNEQSSNGRTGRQRKRQAKKNQQSLSSKDGSGIPSFQPPTIKERSIIRLNHCFLIRNLEKIRKLKERTAIVSSLTRGNNIIPSQSQQQPQNLTAQISALRVPRNIKTRGLALVEHDPELEKTARIAGVLREICQELSNYKDENNSNFISKLNIPSKKKSPKYFEIIKNPIDLPQIEVNVEKGLYKNPKLFDDDVLRVFNNAILFYGKQSKEFISIESVKNFYKTIKEKYYDELFKIFGGVCDMISEFKSNKSDLNEIDKKNENHIPEDIIRCLCGLYRDEGLMIQCSKCFVWQHAECTRADTTIENYLCERCDSTRVVDLEIPLNEFTDEGYRYFLSLLRGDLQIRQSDTVYVLRDIPIDPKQKDGIIKKHTYETIGDIDYSECDIFRVERLWKDNNNKKFIFGHHYLRPHETYHEPTRKFYPNEVVRVPLYEVVPIELVMAKCWVLDPTTYCKGRPIDSNEDHVYICELRVDKAAKMFTKISKHQYPVCTKSYAFRKFDQRLKISKTYAPHDLDSVVLKIKPKKEKKKSEENTKSLLHKNSTSIVQLIPPPPKTINEKRNRLENILSKLLIKQQKESNSPPIDISYLLTGRGARLRRANATSVPL